MTNLNLSSAKEIKLLVRHGAIAHSDALAHVDAVLARKTLSDGKKARWLRLREWLMKAQKAV